MGELCTGRSLRVVGGFSVALLLAAGCSETPAPPRPGGGGGGGGGGGAADAGPPADGPVATVTIRGRLCTLIDLRQPTACDARSFDGFSISFAGETATAAADGTVSLDVALTTTSRFAEVVAPGANLRKTLVALDPAAFASNGSLTASLPVLTSGDFADLLAVTAAAMPSGTGGVVLYVRDNGVPVAGAVVPAPPTALNPTLYDQGGPLAWGTVQTGSLGTALLLGVPTTTGLSLTATTALGELSYAGIIVQDGAVTFAVPSYF